MAQVDFSNAILDVKENPTVNPMASGSTMQFYYSSNLFDSSGTVISTNQSFRVATDTPTKRTMLYTGAFSASGTEFYLGQSNGGVWRVSNISFSSGDSYAFEIDVEISGNT